ncbi:MAG: GIY-YIG nuclease family protein [Patescibacteria group bacterium]
MMVYCVYILKSSINNDIYVGSTENLEKRVIRHNAGKVKSTKAYRPWKLLEYRECNSRSEAMKFEKFLKTGQQKEILKKKYGGMAK